MIFPGPFIRLSSDNAPIVRKEMPRTKVLKGVAHNVGASFTSLTNYSMGHILRFARETGSSNLTIDLLNGQGCPDALLQEPVSDLPSRYSDMFLRLVKSSGSDKGLVQSATLTLDYDLQRSQPSARRGHPQGPYRCAVSIVDIRGKDYVAHFKGWWFVEKERGKLPTDLSIPRWWNPLTWF